MLLGLTEANVSDVVPTAVREANATIRVLVSCIFGVGILGRILCCAEVVQVCVTCNKRGEEN
jgi:hypothetical protein